MFAKYRIKNYTNCVNAIFYQYCRHASYVYENVKERNILDVDKVDDVSVKEMSTM